MVQAMASSMGRQVRFHAAGPGRTAEKPGHGDSGSGGDGDDVEVAERYRDVGETRWRHPKWFFHLNTADRHPVPDIWNIHLNCCSSLGERRRTRVACRATSLSFFGDFSKNASPRRRWGGGEWQWRVWVVEAPMVDARWSFGWLNATRPAHAPLEEDRVAAIVGP